MKKIGVFAILFLLVLSILPVFAAVGDDCDSDYDCDSGQICKSGECAIGNSTTNTTTTATTSSSSSSSSQQNPNKIKDGFKCLEEKAKDCASLTTQEVALTILATPDNIFDDCVDELKSRKNSDNWGNVRDTALAILALKHAGQETKTSEEWLISQEKTPTDLTWYLEQDSNTATECHIGYNSNGYTITVGENKKIDGNAGPCLTKAQSNFWLQISPSCFESEFSIECDKDFIATLLYKNQKSSTIYVLEGTESSPAFGSIKLEVSSKCFGSSSCDYESTAWAAVALLKTGHNIKEYIPYIIAMSDTNERYLPDAFVYILTNYEDYATQLVASQKLGNYWEAKQTANNKFYDTSLALLALGSSSSEQISKAKDWLLFSQGSNGCWQNSVKETAIVLWALEGRLGRSSGGSSGVTYCSQAGYFCIPSSECSKSQDVGDNYYCQSLSDTCCITENLKTCSEYGGKECPSGEICVGNSRKASDSLSGKCCTGTCQEKPTQTECESKKYTCEDYCLDSEEEVLFSCNSGEVCCKTKPTNTGSGGGIPAWIWILIILILIVLVIIAWLKREELKLYIFKVKTRFKKDKNKGQGAPAMMGRPGPPGPPRPPVRPGFPPIRRPMPPVAPVKKRAYDRRDSAMAETFKKLREMSD